MLYSSWGAGVHETKALRSAALLALLLCNCGPQYGGGGGSAGSVGEAGEASSAGSGGSATAGASATGGGGTGDVGGSSPSAGSSPTSPSDEAVIGCEAAAWPDAGYLFQAPPVGEFSDRAETLLGRFTAAGISGDGKLVVGNSPDRPYSRGLPISWSLADGLVELPSPPYETTAFQTSCDGSVVLEQDILPFQQVYRSSGPGEPVVVSIGSPPRAFVHANPDASIVVNGYGLGGEFGKNPLRWTAETGIQDLPALHENYVYGVAPDGALLAADPTVLYEYDVESDVRSPVGMSPVDFGSYATTSLVASADGNAWVQSADLNFDSFLVWRAPAEPRSVSCPTTCQVVDLSGTGLIALIDMALAPDDSRTSSWVWTKRDGLVDLTEAFQSRGFDLQGRKLRAAAMSDDGRAFAGYAFDPTIGGTGAGGLFFYGVLPAGVYE
ncbi:MAG TPA: hypothetical protein VEQ59_21925 [Polyangiaceae bacterium]|nr:hypothetical protein [Polyangiaceae bacterium]